MTRMAVLALMIVLFPGLAFVPTAGAQVGILPQEVAIAYYELLVRDDYWSGWRAVDTRLCRAYQLLNRGTQDVLTLREFVVAGRELSRSRILRLDVGDPVFDDTKKYAKVKISMSMYFYPIASMQNLLSDKGRISDLFFLNLEKDDGGSWRIMLGDDGIASIRREADRRPRAPAINC